MAHNSQIDDNDGTFLFASESVGEGHSDKLCDQVSDAILDEFLKVDPTAKVAVETVTKTGMVMCVGEVSSTVTIDYSQVVRKTICEIGYDDARKGLDGNTCNLLLKIADQSPDIAQAVHTNRSIDDLRAGDQGMMFGYATDETTSLMPLTLELAHGLNRKLGELRRAGELDWARPDSKTLVTIQYRGDVNGACVPERVHAIVMSVQHAESVSIDQIRKDLKEKVINKVVPSHMLDKDTVYYLNPGGRFVIGGPQSDAGVTGRKGIVDTYGGWGSHGGGAFSGKDPTKMDRSAGYAARWIAKSLVHAKLCHRVLVQLSYAIGVKDPLSIYVNAYGTGCKTDYELIQIVRSNFDLTPGGIIKSLDLLKPVYRKTAVYGHFGRDEFTWEQPRKLHFE